MVYGQRTPTRGLGSRPRVHSAALRARLARALVTAFVIATIVFVARRLPIRDLALALVQWARSAGTAGIVAYMLFYAVCGAVAAPMAFFSAAGGFAYGPWVGFVAAWPAMVCSSVVGFYAGRTVLRRFVLARLAATGDAQQTRWRKINHAMQAHGFKMVTLIRMSPLFPQNLMHSLLGTTDVNVGAYAAGTAIGMLPMTLLHVYVGSVVTSAAQIVSGATSLGGTGITRWLVLAAGLVSTLLLAWALARTARRAFERAVAAEPDDAS